MATDNVDLPDLSHDSAAGAQAALLNTDGARRKRRPNIPPPTWKRCSTCRSRFPRCWARARWKSASCSSWAGAPIVELDRKVGEAIDIYVNDRLVARGEVVLVEDRLGITMTEIIKAGSGS